jgi:competence protein ComEC
VFVGILGLYVLVVGAQPSITRAVLMGMAVALALWLGRGRLQASQALALSVVVGLLYEPRWLFELGAQLSVLAVLGMVVFGPPVASITRHWPTLPGVYSVVILSRPISITVGQVLRALATMLAATLGAQAFTLPLIASNFGLVPPFAAIVNLIVEPLIAILVPLGFVAALLGPLSIIINWFIGILVWVLLVIVSVAAQLPNIPWGHIGIYGIVAYAGDQPGPQPNP